MDENAPFDASEHFILKKFSKRIFQPVLPFSVYGYLIWTYALHNWPLYRLSFCTNTKSFTLSRPRQRAQSLEFIHPESYAICWKLEGAEA